MIQRHWNRRIPGSRAARQNERRGFTLPEVATVVAVLVCLFAVIAPYLLKTWEVSRQATCRERLKALGVGVASYHKEAGRFPEGQRAFRFKSNDLGRYADPEEARAPSGEKASGVSWVVPILSHLGQTSLAQNWQGEASVAQNASAAQTDLAGLYCPSRRSSLAASRYSGCERLTESWRGGGSDYAGCSGAGISFNDEAHQTYALTEQQLTGTMRGGLSLMSAFPARSGIFGVNSRVTMDNVRDGDGLAWVILIAERRLSSLSTPAELRSSDGWAWGGPATLFSTRFGPHSGRHFSEADSEHPNLIHVCMADSVVRKVNWNIDLGTWNDLGSYADGRPITHPDFRR